MPKLKDPQLELFCQERARAGATDISAYAAAGYTVKDRASTVDGMSLILADAKVSARIAEIHVAEALLANGVTPEKVLQRLARIAFTDIGQVVQWGDTVVRVINDGISGRRKIVIERTNWIRAINSSNISDGAVAAIDKIWRKADGSILGVTLRSPMPALVLLGKHLGMWPKLANKRRSARGKANFGHQNEPSVYVDRGPRETREEWEARARRRFATSAAEGKAAAN